MNWKITTEQAQVKIYDFLTKAKKQQNFMAWVLDAEEQINCYGQCILEYKSRNQIETLILVDSDFQ